METSGQQTGTCIYCGKSGPVTDDHIPPKMWFPKPRPIDLITVKACASCHAPWSEGDEYVKHRVAMSVHAIRHPYFNYLIGKAHRHIARREGWSKLRALLLGARTVRLVLPGGLIREEVLMDVNSDLADSTVGRYGQALHHHLTGFAVHQAEVTAYRVPKLERAIESQNPEGGETVLGLLNQLRCRPMHTRGADAAFYFRHMMLSDERSAVLEVGFLGEVSWLVFVVASEQD